jgi:hypothetical protein
MYIQCKIDKWLTQIRLINSEHLTVINVDIDRLAITAYIVGHEKAVTLGKYDTIDDCKLAYDTLTETLKARKELFDMDVK